MPDAGDRARATRIINRLVSYGVEVRVMPGHEVRGGTFVEVPRYVFDHHDASSRKSGEWGSLGLILDGTPRGIPGPLSNAQVARCLDGVPRVAWVADGTCSHAGAGSGFGLPASNANSRTYGVEKANDGISEPYTAAANYATNALFHAMAVECGGNPGAFPLGHKEWTTRKVDPIYAMPDRRRQVAAFTASQGDDLSAKAEDQIEYLFNAFLNGGPDASPSARPLKDLIQEAANNATQATINTAPISRTGDPNADGQGQVSLRQEVADTKSLLLALTAKQAALEEALRTVAAAGSSDVDVEALLARVDAQVKASVAAGLAEGVDVDITVGGQPA